MKYLMQQMERREAEQKRPVLIMEIDYELMTLADALKENNEQEITQAKERLHALHGELMEIQNHEENE